jgi:hypothetical protein
MTWVETPEFEFELPGDGWENQSVQSFLADDESMSYHLSRTKLPEGGVQTVLGVWRDEMVSEADDWNVVSDGEVEIGAQVGLETRVVARAQGQAQYFRVLTVPYYEIALTFCWSGMAASMADIDRTADAVFAGVKFWSRQ